MKKKAKVCQTPQEISETCSKIREVYMQRQQVQQAILRLQNQIKAIERRMNEAIPVKSSSRGLPASAGSSKEFETSGCPSDDACLSHVPPKVSTPSGDAVGHSLRENHMSYAAASSLSLVCPMLMMAMDALAPQLKMLEKRLENEAKKLPIVAQLPKGLGALGLGKIIGECGELSNYSTPAKLWRRMGMAPYNGRSGEQWRVRGGLTAAEWSDYGYSARRRSVMFTIGTFVMMAKNPEYTALYAARKEYEQSKEPDAKPIVWHKRAKRYMEKSLLLNLWKAWRDAARNLNSIADVHSQPSAILPEAMSA